MVVMEMNIWQGTATALIAVEHIEKENLEKWEPGGNETISISTWQLLIEHWVGVKDEISYIACIHYLELLWLLFPTVYLVAVFLKIKKLVVSFIRCYCCLMDEAQGLFMEKYPEGKVCMVVSTFRGMVMSHCLLVREHILHEGPPQNKCFLP